MPTRPGFSLLLKMAPASVDLARVEQQLTAMVRAKTSDSHARVHEVAPLPGGHSSFGCSFIAEAGGSARKYVLRLAPEGVRAAGPADVVLQARRMESLAGTEVAVPPIIWYGYEPEFFGRGYFVAGFVDSFKLAERPDLSPERVRKLARMGVRTLAALHRVDWNSRRGAWGDPQPLLQEIDRLDRLLDRPTLDPREVARGPELRDRLRASAPESPVGCVQGDYQWENILFSDDRVAAVIDWEMALLGASLLDLGWLCFFAEPGAGVDLAGMNRITPLTVDEIVTAYSQARGFAVSEKQVRWFRAFASFRLGALACFNVMLHRRGKRHDPEWENLVRSAPAMFESGLALLG